MIQINLIPDVKQELIKAQRVRSVVISISILTGMASVGILALLCFWVFAVQSVRSGILDDDIDKKGVQLSEVKDLSKILTIQNQLSKIESLSQTKTMDSRLFDMLNSVIPAYPNDVKISAISIDSDNKAIEIEGQAAEGYAALEIFKKTILGSYVRYLDSDSKAQKVKLSDELSTSDVSYGEDSSGVKVLRFTMRFKYVDELFSPDSKSVSVVVENRGNVTDSYLGIPKSVFADKAKDIEEKKGQ